MLSSQKFQDFAATNHLYVPSNKKSWKTYQTANTKGKHLESFIKHVYSRPHGFHFYNAGMNAAGTAIQNEIDLVYLDKKKLEDALRDANKKANEVVNFGNAKQPFLRDVKVPATENSAERSRPREAALCGAWRPTMFDSHQCQTRHPPARPTRCCSASPC